MILLGSALTLLVCAGAYWKGGPPERGVSVATFVTLVVATIGQIAFGRNNAWPVIIAELVLGFGLIACAALYTRRWLYLQVAIAAALLFIHAFMLGDEADVPSLTKAVVDSLNLLIIGILAWATWRSWRRAS